MALCMDEDNEIQCHINDLCPEILLTIFSYLDVTSKFSVSQVCRRWRDIGYSKELWAKITVTIHGNRILSQSQKAQTQHWSRKRSVSDRTKHIDTSKDTKELDQSVVFSSLGFRGIQRLQIVPCIKRCLSTTDPITIDLQALHQGIPYLERLSLVGPIYTPSKSCLWYGHASLGSAGFKNLTHLSLPETTVNEEALDVAAKTMPNLTNLSVPRCVFINDACLIVMTKFKYLKKLNVSFTNITEKGLSYICGLAGSLDNESQQDIHCRLQLEALHVEQCRYLTPNAVYLISNHMQSLTLLNVSNNDRYVEFIRDDISNLAKLKHLLAYHCQLSNKALKIIAEGRQSLETLFIHSNWNITDEGMEYFTHGFETLKFLSLSACQITDKGIETLSTNLPELIHLELKNLPITNKSLRRIKTKFPKLQYLAVDFCSRLTCGGIQDLVKHYEARGITTMIDRYPKL